jgi:hypothetical protein
MKILAAILFFASASFAGPDLVAPFTVDLKSSKSFLFDTVVVTSYLSNNGTTNTLTQSFDATIISIGVDSFNIFAHKIPASYYMGPNTFVTFKDTLAVIKGSFSIHTWCDPLLFFGEGGGQINNNIRSQAYNFHPTTVHDTVLLIDTLKLAVHDTVKITVHDTVKIASAAAPKFSAAVVSVPSTVYDAIGRPEWSGMLAPGGFPMVKLHEGLHLIVQGASARRFRVAYK